MARYVHIEPRMSMTAMSADEWIAPVPGTEALVALTLAHVVANHHADRAPADATALRALLRPYEPEDMAARTGIAAETYHRLAEEFTASPSVALPGGIGTQHVGAHRTAVAVHLLNYLAGNVGRTVVMPAGGAGGADRYSRLAELVAAARAGNVKVLLLHGANPVYATPAGLGVGDALAQVPFKVSFSRFLDETTQLADLVLPDHDPYEQWNDYVPRPGVWSLLQPVMQPVFDTRQTGDVLLSLARQAGGTAAATFGLGGATQDLYQAYLQARWADVQRDAGDRRPFETFWHAALQRGRV